MENEWEGEGENGELAEGRKFEKEEENGDRQEVGERKMDWRDGREGRDEREGRTSQSRAESARRRANEGANREKNAYGKIGCC